MLRNRLEEYAFIIHTDALTNEDWSFDCDYFEDISDLPPFCLELLHLFAQCVYLQTKYWLQEQCGDYWDEESIDRVIQSIVSTVHAELCSRSCVFKT